MPRAVLAVSFETHNASAAAGTLNGPLMRASQSDESARAKVTSPVSPRSMRRKLRDSARSFHWDGVLDSSESSGLGAGEQGVTSGKKRSRKRNVAFFVTGRDANVT